LGGAAYASRTTVWPTFVPSKRPVNAVTAWSIPLTGVSGLFNVPARRSERLTQAVARDGPSEVWLGGRDSNPDNVVQSHKK